MNFKNVLMIELQLEPKNVDKAIEGAISLWTNGLSDAWESDKWERTIEMVKNKYQVLLEELS